MEAKSRIGQLSQKFLGRYKSRRPSSLPTDFRSFVGTDGKSVSVPPATSRGGKDPLRQGWTHTHTRLPKGRPLDESGIPQTEPIGHS